MPVYKNEERNTWYASFYYTDWTGQRKRKKKEGFALKRDAQEYEREYIKKHSGSCEMSFRSMCELYLDDAKNHLKPTSYRVKKNIIDNLILPQLGEMPINEITPNTLRQFNNRLLKSDKEYSTLYLSKVNGQISCVFTFAVRYYNLSSNPCKIYSSPSGTKKADIQFWTLQEFKKFIQEVEGIDYKTAFEVLFWTGMRNGEMLALNVGGIDFKNNRITINKNFAKLDNEELILTPKTKKSKRVVDIPPFLTEHIREYTSHIYDCSNDTRLFSMSRPSLRLHLNEAAERAGVKKIRLHDLRHSHASLLIELGFQPLIVADRLGHENVKTTLETYAHLYPHKQSTVCEKLEELQ